MCAKAVISPHSIRLLAMKNRKPAPDEALKTARTDEEWRADLTPEQYAVLRKHGTERPFSSPLNGEKRPGMFVCAGCGEPLYPSNTKFESGSGWPSFWRPVSMARWTRARIIRG